ncbi:MAG: hypothetical protein LQ341_003499 [Variospora aurantia]|nr:MAG: hypothetical protein LQ341_003499 [Variospora aurantia]
MHLEAKYPRRVPLFRFFWHEGREDLEKDIGEAGAKVGTVDGGVAGRFRVVEVLAAGAVELDRGGGGEVRQAGREERVPVAEDARAFAEVRTYHFAQSSRGGDVARVHQSVEVAGRLLDLLPHVVIAVKVEDIGDKVEGVLVVLDVGVEAGEVEAVGQILLVNLAEVFVAA